MEKKIPCYKSRIFKIRLEAKLDFNLFFNYNFSDNTLTNDLGVNPPAQLPHSLATHHPGEDEGLLQLEPPLTSSEYSFSLDEQENLNDLFDSLPF